MKNPPALAFEDHFHLSLGDLQKILNISLSRSGDFSEIYLEYKIYNFINMEEDIIKETAESISLGLGIRVLSGEKTGYGYTNDLSFAKIKKAALTAASIASSRTMKETSPLSQLRFHHNFYPVLESPHGRLGFYFEVEANQIFQGCSETTGHKKLMLFDCF